MPKPKKTESSEPVIVEAPKAPINCVPPVLYARNDFGLLINTNYVFNEDGTVNWRKMIKPEYLVPNKDKFSADVDLKAIDVTTLEDNQLLILLGGIKDLAQIRGYTSVDYKVVDSGVDYVSVKCIIKWIPNYESGVPCVTESIKTINFAALADAHYGNTNNFASSFLMAIAENRAFVRAVRNFLRINIAGQDEVGGKTDFNKTSAKKEEGSITDPVNALKKAMEQVGLTFEQIKGKLVNENDPDAPKWESISDIPAKRVYSLIDRIKKKNK